MNERQTAVILGVAGAACYALLAAAAGARVADVMLLLAAGLVLIDVGVDV